jgi:hypothetical protein
MRNLLLYPLTYNEVIDYLSEQKTKLEEDELIGDVRPMILDFAINAVKTQKSTAEAVNTWSENVHKELEGLLRDLFKGE